ncbi:hypothetical protein, partial [Bradyrhizobium retamae]|uniref:hypothetical protein n=1 Tax=Bradyrhizobium retamae TaxID=1300035 RepID=UPI001FDA7EEE
MPPTAKHQPSDGMKIEDDAAPSRKRYGRSMRSKQQVKKHKQSIAEGRVDDIDSTNLTKLTCVLVLVLEHATSPQRRLPWPALAQPAAASRTGNT